MRMLYAIVWGIWGGRSLEEKSRHNIQCKSVMRINMLILLFYKIMLSSL